MFDIGGWEFLVIIVIAVIVVGPKDLPAAIRTVTGWIRKARELARDFQSGLDDLAREAELDSVRNDIQSGLGLDEMRDAGNSIRREIEHSIDPQDGIAGAFKDDDAPLPDAYPEEDDPEEPTPPRPEIGTSDSPATRRRGEPPPDDAPPAANGESADAVKKA